MIRPLRNNLWVELDESLPTQAGIHLPPDVTKWRESTDQIGNRGTVRAVGPGRQDLKGSTIPMQVSVGDRVCFSELQYPKEVIDGKTFVMISEMDVNFVMEEAA